VSIPELINKEIDRLMRTSPGLEAFDQTGSPIVFYSKYKEALYNISFSKYELNSTTKKG
jgi:hypothetical protein